MHRRALAALLPALVALGCASAPPLPAGPAADLLRDVRHLASPALEGRATGTPGNASAARFVAERFERLGLRPAFPAGYYQEFRVPGATARNVGAVVPGADPALRGQAVVVGAHYDHVGRAFDRAADPDAPRVVHPGADDNASGTAALLELARRLAAAPPRRTVLLVAFGAEEIGLVGSQRFVAAPPLPIDSVAAMVNLDMVGRLGRGPVIAYGHWTPALRLLLDSASRATGVRVAPRGAGSGNSDHASFGRAGVPAVHLFTGTHADYHRPGDVAARIDAAGLARVVDLAERLARLAADAAAPVRGGAR